MTTVPGDTAGIPDSSRSSVHPAGAPTLMLSTRTALSPAFQIPTSICKRSPCVTMPSSAVPSMLTPAAIAIARSSKLRCSGSAEPSTRNARTRYGSVAAGRHGVSTARAESISAAYPGTRTAVSTPANTDGSLVAGMPGLVATSATRAVAGPARCNWPMSCERCRLRLAIAIWKYDCPRIASRTPTGSASVVADVSPRVER